MANRSKYWCITLNNWTQEEYDNLMGLPSRGKTTYLIIGKEVGVSGTRHLQIYAELSQRIRLAGAKSMFGDRVHLERRRGTAAEAADYVKQ